MVKSEPFPSLVTHIMPDPSYHGLTLNCRCNPKVENIGQAAVGTVVRHSHVAGERYMASKTD